MNEMLFTRGIQLCVSLIIDKILYKMNKAECFEHASGSFEDSWNYFEITNFEKKSSKGAINGKM